MVVLWAWTRAGENTLSEIYMAIVTAQKLKPAYSIFLIQSKISSWDIVKHPWLFEHLFQWGLLSMLCIWALLHGPRECCYRPICILSCANLGRGREGGVSKQLLGPVLRAGTLFPTGSFSWLWSESLWSVLTWNQPFPSSPFVRALSFLSTKSHTLRSQDLQVWALMMQDWNFIQD